MSSVSLIDLLSHGRFVSGVELAERLSVSRTTIWKQLNNLEHKGIAVEKVRGRGYRIPGGLSMIRLEGLRSGLAFLRPCDVVELRLFDEVGSTNSFLVGDSGKWVANNFYLAVAEAQTSGRGRRGKEWFSPYAKNLYFSLGFVFEGGFDSLDGLSVVVGVLLAEALSNEGVSGVELKWPNDIYLSGRKLGGVLIELAGEFNSRCSVIVGVGLNVDLDSESSNPIDQPWTSLKAEGVRVDRTELLTKLSAALMGGVSEFLRIGVGGFVERWAAFDYLKGRCVKTFGVVGLAMGIKSNGCLIIDCGGQEVLINSGEVSVRLADDSD